MISRHNRFHGHNSLSYVYRQGKTVRLSLCMLRVAPNNRRDTYRIAVVVSKKLSKSAVVRNRIRRRVYAVVQGMVAADMAYDLVFTATSPQLAVVSEKELNKTIFQLLQMSGVGKGDRE